MGRWSSDVYQLYCRMSAESALGVSRSIASAAVTSFESAFRDEVLELQPHELQFTGITGEGIEEDEDAYGVD
jgi:hypothetical protein